MKKITFLLSALFFAFTVFAQNVAKIGETEYPTLQDAVDAVTADQEIELLADLELAAAVNLNKDVAYTLNLGGKTLEFKNAPTDPYLLELSLGDVAIKNGIILSDKKAIHVTGGKLTLKSDVAIEAVERVLGIYNAGHVVVENGCELATTADEEWGIVIIGSTSAVTGNPRLDFAGKLTALGSESMGISGNGLDKNQPVINILDGAEILANHVAIYQPGNATMTISGGTITGATAVYVKSGNVSINGGKLVGNGAAADYSFNSNGANPTGAALVIDNCNYPSGAVPAVTIADGEFESENAAAVSSYVGNGVAEAEKIVDFIEGGSFDGAEALPAELVKADAEIVLEDAVINVAPASWKTTLTLVDGKAEADKAFEISGEHLIAAISGEIKGENKDNFVWNSTKEVVKFSANAAGTFKAELVLASKGADTVKVALEVVVNAPAPAPAIIVAPTEWKENVELKNGKAEAEHQFSIYGTNLTAALNIQLMGENTCFTWDNAKQLLKFSATAKSVYKDTILVASEGAESKKIAIEITVVDAPVVPVAVTGVTLDKSSASLKVDETLTLVATVAPADAETKTVTWSSSDATIASVANGVVTAKKEGTAVISVKTTDGGFNAFCVVTVTAGDTPTPPTPTPGGDAFTLVTNPATLVAGDEILIVSTSKGKAAATYNSSKNYFAEAEITISEGSITLNENTPVVVFTLGGESGAWTLSVDNQLVGATAAKSLALGSGTTTWAITIDDNNDASIASTDASLGRILHNSQSSRFCNYTSAPNAQMLVPQIYRRSGGTQPTDPVAVTGVTLDKNAAEVEVGQTVKLTATIAPANATNKKVSWSSDKPAIATVADGVVTGVAEGTAVITVTTEDGAKTASATITVKKADTPTPPTPTEVTFTKVTTAPTDWSGQYLLVCEDAAVAFNGKDATNNGVAATISGSTVTVADYANYIVTIAKMDGGYSVKVTDGYIGGKLDNKGAATNGIDFKEEAILNTISLDNGVLNVESNGATIRFNGAADQKRFRYFKNASLTTNTDLVNVALYKASGEVTPPPAWEPDTLSVAAAVLACEEGKTHYVDGVITNISTSAEDIAKYGNLNFTLADINGANAVISCFRLNWKTKDGKFTGNEVAVGDTVRVFGTTSIYTKDDTSTPQVSNGYVVEILGKGNGTPVVPGEQLDVDYVDAAYIVDGSDIYWQLLAAKYPTSETATDYDYPHLYLFVDNTDKTHIAGTFDLYEGSFIVLAAGDTTYFAGGSVEVTCVEAATDQSDPVYSFVVTLVDEAGNEVTYSFEAAVGAWDWANSTEEETAWIDLEDVPGEQAIENVIVDIDINTPMYNIQGMQVDSSARGIIIQNGRKFIIVH